MDLTATITVDTSNAQAFLDGIKAKAEAGEDVGSIHQVMERARDLIDFDISTEG